MVRTKEQILEKLAVLAESWDCNDSMDFGHSAIEEIENILDAEGVEYVKGE